RHPRAAHFFPDGPGRLQSNGKFVCSLCRRLDFLFWSIGSEEVPELFAGDLFLGEQAAGFLFGCRSTQRFRRLSGSWFLALDSGLGPLGRPPLLRQSFPSIAVPLGLGRDRITLSVGFSGGDLPLSGLFLLPQVFDVETSIAGEIGIDLRPFL